jgi:hypothetical protein
MPVEAQGTHQLGVVQSQLRGDLVNPDDKIIGRARFDLIKYLYQIFI